MSHLKENASESTAPAGPTLTNAAQQATPVPHDALLATAMNSGMEPDNMTQNEWDAAQDAYIATTQQ